MNSLPVIFFVFELQEVDNEGFRPTNVKRYFVFGQKDSSAAAPIQNCGSDRKNPQPPKVKVEMKLSSMAQKATFSLSL